MALPQAAGFAFFMFMVWQDRNFYRVFDSRFGFSWGIAQNVPNNLAELILYLLQLTIVNLALSVPVTPKALHSIYPKLEYDQPWIPSLHIKLPELKLDDNGAHGGGESLPLAPPVPPVPLRASRAIKTQVNPISFHLFRLPLERSLGGIGEVESRSAHVIKSILDEIVASVLVVSPLMLDIRFHLKRQLFYDVII